MIFNLHRHKALHWIALTACAAMLAFAPSSARAQDDLTPEQRNRLRAAMESARKETDEMYQRLRQSRHQLFRLYESYNLDERKINETARWINRIQNDILNRHLRTQREIRRIVNPAQFEELKKTMRSMRERDRGRGGRERKGRRHPGEDRE